VREAEGLVIKNDPRVLMMIKGTNHFCGMVKHIDNDSTGSRGHHKCKKHQESYINV